MKDFYEILGISPHASKYEIKQAYRRSALVQHPDKQGDKDRMILLNEAYNTLIDTEKRKYYEETRHLNHLFEEEEEVKISGYLTGTGLPFSHSYKLQHKQLVTQYNDKPLDTGNTRDYLTPSTFTLFSELKEKADQDSYLLRYWQDFTPQVAVNLLIGFLEGYYFGEALQALLGVFFDNINELKRAKKETHLLLYEGIYDLLFLSVSELLEEEKFILALNKITQYAKKMASDTFSPASLASMSTMTSLFQHTRFRQLFAHCLHKYWFSEKDRFDPITLKAFEGEETAQKLIQSLKERLKSGETNASLPSTLRLLLLLSRLEKHLKLSPKEEEAYLAQFYRKKGYQILDWMPTLFGLANQSVIINTFLQAGMCFQKASQLESQSSLKMADEKLSFRIYLLSLGISHYASPDIELYINVQVLYLITQYQYQDADLAEVIPLVQHRSLSIANLFPFFQSWQSNIELLLEEDQLLNLMRQLLQSLIAIMEHNKNHEDKLFLDHDYVTLLYQAYEACLKNWYSKNYEPEIEASFRLKLMEELLRINHWSFSDVNQFLNSSWISVSRDRAGWMQPQRSLSLPGDELDYFSAIEGLELNAQTGKINFLCKRWKEGDTSYNRLFTAFDIRDICKKKLTSAIFSLDPVDPEKPLHPFNKMRFAPTSLYQSQLFHMMLLTDLLLKFLTVGQEVQGDHPYAMRSWQTLMKSMPQYLQQIIKDFHDAHQSEAIHRFWIEAEEVPVVINEPGEKDHTLRFVLSDIRMVIKKHKMVRTPDGELIDQEEKDEGWFIYVLAAKQEKLWQKNKENFQMPALIFIEPSNRVYFLEEKSISGPLSVKDYDHQLKRLYKLKRTPDQRVESINSNSMRLIYRVTKEITAQAAKAHHFTPEFIFAQEFSIHYNEFAIHFPELGRLRELSKIVAVVNLLENQRLNNLEQIEQISKQLTDHDFWREIRAKITPEVTKVMWQNFANWYEHFSTENLKAARQQTLSSLLAQIGTLTFTSLSPEIQRIATDRFEEIKSQIISQHGYDAWYRAESEIWSKIQSGLSDLAEKISQQKLDKLLKELKEAFENELADISNYERDILLKDFLNGYSENLLYKLIAYDEQQVLRKIHEVYPSHSQAVIYDAVNGKAYAKKIMLEQEVERGVEQNKAALQDRLNGLKKLNTSMTQLGLAKSTKEKDLTKNCLWVPASIYHDVEKGRSRMVYGGVRILPRIINLNQTNRLMAQTLSQQVLSGRNPPARMAQSMISQASKPAGSLAGGGGRLPPSGGGSGSGSGGDGRSGGGPRHNPLLDLLKIATQTKNKPNQFETTLADGTKVFFRKDVGKDAHPLSHPYPDGKKIDHFNVEVQIPNERKKNKKVENLHIVVNAKLEPVHVYNLKRETLYGKPYIPGPSK